MARLSKTQRQELWQERLERYCRSDVTVAQFCQRENISVAAFYNWKRRLATITQTSPTTTQAPPTTTQAPPTTTPTPPTITQTPPPTPPTVTQAPPQRSSVHRGFAEVLVGVPQTAEATLAGGITITLGTHRETVTLIIDRLLQHAADQRDPRESDKANGSC